MNIDPKLALAEAANTPPPYDPSKGWDSTAQKYPGGSAEDYYQLATHAEATLQEEMISYCNERGLSYVVVPHTEFQSGYERNSGKTFREWLKEFCAESHQDPKADVMIMTRVKTLESAERKSANNPAGADRHKDYLGGLFLHLHEPSNPKSKKEMHALQQSVAQFGQALKDMENNHRTLARNNLFYAPLEHGFRAHKAAWAITIPEGNPLGGLAIVVSIKTEHESLMGMDRLTRKFMTMKRETSGSFLQLFSTCVSDLADMVSAGRNLGRLHNRSNILTELGKLLYDHVHQRLGFNGFLGEEHRAKFAALETPELRQRIRTVDVQFSGTSLEKLIDQANVLPRTRTAWGWSAQKPLNTTNKFPI